MQLRIRSSFVWAVLHIFGFVIGLLVLGYAIFSWAGYGFTFGPDQHLHPGAPDPSAGDRYLVLAGFTLTAYCAFAVYIFDWPSRDSNTQSDDAETPSI
jgi:hypothetical protein